MEERMKAWAIKKKGSWRVQMEGGLYLCKGSKYIEFGSKGEAENYIENYEYLELSEEQ